MQDPAHLSYRIYLIGFMGSGKTFQGKRLAEALHYDFLDLDEWIESNAGLSIPEIFDQFGEDHFRKLEREALLSTSKKTKIVVATGGGAPCFFDNLDQMKNGGIVIYLEGSPDLLMQRLENESEQRPLLANKSKAELKTFIESKIKERQSIYEKAHAIIHLQGNDDPVIEIALQFLKFV